LVEDPPSLNFGEVQRDFLTAQNQLRCPIALGLGSLLQESKD